MGYSRYEYGGRQQQFPYTNLKGLNSTLSGKGVKYTYDPGDLTWLLACTSVTWIMLPGVGFFYNGLARSKSSLGLFILCFWSCAIVSVQWWIIGYTLCLSSTGGPFIGNLDHLFLRNIGDMPSVPNPKVPAALLGVWYCLFAAIAPTVFIGGIAERARFFPTVIFMVLWTTFVFDFIVYWTWNENGWSNKLGTLDFGGGTPIHTSTGVTALAYALMLGKRKDRSERPPHNMTHVVLGTSFIWMGWLVANAGSGFSPNLRAVSTFAATNMSASMGGITWGVIDYFWHGRKWSPLGFCCGVVAGLVAVTPASGFISTSSSVVFGFLGSVTCNLALAVKRYIPIDDAFDVFCVHGVGAITGNILTGIFAEKSIAALDGTTKISGGGLYDGNWAQVGIQAIDTLAGSGWAFFVSLVILCIINSVRQFEIRASEQDEENGLDRAELGYNMYEFVEELKTKVEYLNGRVTSLENGNSKGNNMLISVASSVLTPVEYLEDDIGLKKTHEEDRNNHKDINHKI